MNTALAHRAQMALAQVGQAVIPVHHELRGLGPFRTVELVEDVTPLLERGRNCSRRNR